jgi:hypothetical protein
MRQAFHAAVETASGAKQSHFDVAAKGVIQQPVPAARVPSLIVRRSAD